MQDIKKDNLIKDNIILKKATIDDIDEIINLYTERMNWYNKNCISKFE